MGLRPPANVPPNVDMCKHADIMKKLPIYRIDIFINLVRNSGKWGYKRLNRKYEDFGNYHFGYVAAAYGLPREFAKFGAGVYQIYRGTSKLEWYKSYFDDPNDQYWIDEGYNDYINNYYHCGCNQ